MGGGFVTATLAWDRDILKFGGLDNTFDTSNTFAGALSVEDLDLFIEPVGWTDLYADAVAMSISSDDNVEHIYEEIPAGNYEIVVYQLDGVDRDFGLAWWTGNPADFDQDGDVDGSDFNQWKGDFGENDDSNADFDGDSDGADFLTWQQNYGSGVAAVPVNVSVPEPASWSLLAFGLPLLMRRLFAYHK